MKRWRPARYDTGTKIDDGRHVENLKIDAFLAEIEEVCKRHGLSIGHEDGHGAFEIHDYESVETGWLESAHDCTNGR